MALQSIDAIIVTDPLNPTELTAWFNAHPLTVITTIVIHQNVFYIIHT